MKFRVIACLFFASILIPFHAGAKVGFRGLDLSDDNRLLFRAESSGGGAPSQHGLFISRLTDLALQQITAFPEKMELLDGGGTLQVQNVFGAVRIPLSGGLPRNIPGFPSFIAGVPAAGGRTGDIAASSDGRWALFVEPETYAYGNLVLLEIQSGRTRTVVRHIERPASCFPASWSPDSRVFIYSREGKLYYYAVGSPAGMDERFRLIGEGGINSVTWSANGDFFYLKGDLIYRVRGPELFTRTLYANFLEIGSLAGKIPFEFDPAFDFFRMSDDARSVLVCRGRRAVFYCLLEPDDYASNVRAVLPYVLIPRSSLGVVFLWSPAGIITVMAQVPSANSRGAETLAWRLRADGKEVNFVPLQGAPGSEALLSPDGRRVLIWGEDGVFLYDYVNWRLIGKVSERPGFSCLWINDEEFISGDSGRIERINVRGGRSLLCLSAADEFGFEERGSRVFAKNGGAWFATDGRSPWTETAGANVRKTSLVSGRYRVYLERQFHGPYENLPMIRNTASTGTAPLLPAVQYTGEPLPPAEEEGVPGLFTHGPRGGRREVALCFDLYDDASGLPEVLSALRRYGITATFFLNGDFIRRHPGAAKEIAEAGHEAASMFFAPIDLSDARYRIADEFVARGLARNEDEYYRATGRELSLFWHPPYYAVSAEICAAASRAGYRTVGRDVDPMDWVSRNSQSRQYSASDTIDRIMRQKRPGSIIPVRLGLLSGGRNDYLFLRIEVLLDALVRSGYETVTVSTLLEHAR
ncbi:MAG: polysaccharide deacetylase family protein [Treponema sp.]|jgi:peptidoglycan/xylan/chitin deacetylase (PgdA/CDA1 family)|nr:polysaccharide deacetylase family protein [Treponema sp.]